jgi:hypothetical protein
MGDDMPQPQEPQDMVGDGHEKQDVRLAVPPLQSPLREAATPSATPGVADFRLVAFGSDDITV